MTLSIEISSWAQSGRAIVYASAYTALPSEGGVPYCAEKSSIFIIGSIQGAEPIITPNGNQGYYNLVFRIPPNTPIGAQTVHISSTYNSVVTTGSIPFSVNQPGDFDSDGDVDFDDILTFVDAYIEFTASHMVNPKADLDHDNDIDFNDILAFADAYILYGRAN